MALIKCPECGKDFSDAASKCPHCGYPIIDETEFYKIVKKSGFLSTGRLVVSIVSFVLSAVIIYQGYVLSMAEALLGKSENIGLLGVGVALLIIIAGIIGICTRNKRGIGPFLASVFYFLAFIITPGTGETYPDLPIWGVVALFFGLVFFVCAFANVNVRKNEIEGRKSLNMKKSYIKSVTRSEEGRIQKYEPVLVIAGSIIAIFVGTLWGCLMTYINNV